MDDVILQLVWSGIGYLVALIGAWLLATRANHDDDEGPLGLIIIGLFVSVAFLWDSYSLSGGYGLFDGTFERLSELKQFTLLCIALAFYLANYFGLAMMSSGMAERLRKNKRSVALTELS